MSTAELAAMEVAVLVAPGEIRVEERPVPVPGPGQVLIEVSAVGVCGSDVHYFREGRIGDFVVEKPLVLGHEASGVVRALGAGVSRLERGQRVAMEPGVPCRRCRACRSGKYNLCPDVRFFATPPIDGTFARYVLHDEDFCYPLPRELSDDAGALLEPLSVGVWAAWKARVSIGDRVLVTGAGPIGLLAAAVARSAGAREVIVSDTQEARLELAKRMGATTVVSGGSSDLVAAGDGADVLVECSGSPAALAAGLRALGPGARAVVVGMSAESLVPVPLALVQRQEVELTGTFRYANTYPTAMALAASGEVRLDELVTGHYGLAQVAEALSVGQKEPLAVKPVVLPGS
ncbi:MAG TPA: NAD(P)-dependent alcohol dehydrogenase [Acidimicrobiales bacterium]|nr:NAD(P)-dependent alcohol dehydrogenase [Acidimicrobiales bacterium]